MDLELKLPKKIAVPEGTVLITNSGGWLTLARRNKDLFFILTISTEEITGYDFMDENSWTQYTEKELSKIIKL